MLFAGPHFPEIKTLEKFEKKGINTNVNDKTLYNLVPALLGLTNDEISNVIAKATIRCHGLTGDALTIILDEKKKVIRGSSAFTYVHPEPANSLGSYQSLREI